MESQASISVPGNRRLFTAPWYPTFEAHREGAREPIARAVAVSRYKLENPSWRDRLFEKLAPAFEPVRQEILRREGLSDDGDDDRHG